MSNIQRGRPAKQVLQPYVIRIVNNGRHKSFRSGRDSIRIRTPRTGPSRAKGRQSGPGEPVRFWTRPVIISLSPPPPLSLYSATNEKSPARHRRGPLVNTRDRAIQYPISARSGKSRRVPVRDWFVSAAYYNTRRGDVPESSRSF